MTREREKPPINDNSEVFDFCLPEAQLVEIPADWEEVIKGIRQLGDKFDAKTLDLLPLLKERGALDRVTYWWNSNGFKLESLKTIREFVETTTASFDNVLERAAARYNIEYSTFGELAQLAELPQGLFYAEASSKTNYSFWTPLMDERIFEKLTGLKLQDLKEKSILNVGAGPGDFEKYLICNGVDPSNITCVDLSIQSNKRTNDLGCTSFEGRLEEVIKGRDISPFDLVFLSYFIDRDADQRQTIQSALEILNKGGEVILEGLFPAIPVDPQGMEYVDSNEGLITKGVDPVEDIDLVCEAFTSTSSQVGNKVKISLVSAGIRYVFSRDGLEALPSYTIVCKKQP